MMFSPLAQRRYALFKANKRGYRSFWIFLALFVSSLFAEFIANDKPVVLSYQNELYFPAIRFYSEKTFGGDFETEAMYRDPFVAEKINAQGWMIWPPIHYSYATINYDLKHPAPTPPSSEN